MVRIFGSITSPGSWAHPFHFWLLLVPEQNRIEIGTAVIDMRYENPHYMAEDAGAADLICRWTTSARH